MARPTALAASALLALAGCGVEDPPLDEAGTECADAIVRARRGAHVGDPCPAAAPDRARGHVRRGRRGGGRAAPGLRAGEATG